ncbi:hypothetical protein [Candidatus Williamhamiltonella defendens]
MEFGDLEDALSDIIVDHPACRVNSDSFSRRRSAHWYRGSG